MYWNSRIPYMWLYITGSNSFNFNGIFFKLRIALMSPGMTKHVCNLRWRSTLSKLEKKNLSMFSVWWNVKEQMFVFQNWSHQRRRSSRRREGCRYGGSGEQETTTKQKVRRGKWRGIWEFLHRVQAKVGLLLIDLE